MAKHPTSKPNYYAVILDMDYLSVKLANGPANNPPMARLSPGHVLAFTTLLLSFHLIQSKQEIQTEKERH